MTLRERVEAEMRAAAMSLNDGLLLTVNAAVTVAMRYAQAAEDAEHRATDAEIAITVRLVEKEQAIERAEAAEKALADASQRLQHYESEHTLPDGRHYILKHGKRKSAAGLKKALAERGHASHCHCHEAESPKGESYCLWEKSMWCMQKREEHPVVDPRCAGSVLASKE